MDAFLHLLREKQVLTVKPVGGNSGKGVSFFSHHNSEFYINDSKVEKQELIDFVQGLDNFIITEFVKQHSYARELYPGTTNTIRVVTIREPETGRISVPVAAHRIGTNKSFPVDNVSGGGLSAWIDVEQGTIGKAIRKIDFLNGTGFLENHPDTGSQIYNVKIPHWDLLLKQLVLAMEHLPKVHFIAWDVVITDDSFSVVEVNASTGIYVFQMHQPLLRNPELKRFYEYHRVI